MSIVQLVIVGESGKLAIKLEATTTTQGPPVLCAVPPSFAPCKSALINFLARLLFRLITFFCSVVVIVVAVAVGLAPTNKSFGSAMGRQFNGQSKAHEIVLDWFTQRAKRPHHGRPSDASELFIKLGRVVEFHAKVHFVVFHEIQSEAKMKAIASIEREIN